MPFRLGDRQQSHHTITVERIVFSSRGHAPSKVATFKGHPELKTEPDGKKKLN
jgi:hypothetical protein